MKQYPKKPPRGLVIARVSVEYSSGNVFQEEQRTGDGVFRELYAPYQSSKSVANIASSEASSAISNALLNLISMVPYLSCFKMTHPMLLVDQLLKYLCTFYVSVLQS